MITLYLVSQIDPDLSGRPLRLCYRTICDWVLSVSGHKMDVEVQEKQEKPLGVFMRSLESDD
jgi:hypothetical protein